MINQNASSNKETKKKKSPKKTHHSIEGQLLRGQKHSLPSQEVSNKELTRGNWYKLHEERFYLGLRKKILIRTITHWNNIPRNVMEYPPGGFQEVVGHTSLSWFPFPQKVGLDDLLKSLQLVLLFYHYLSSSDRTFSTNFPQHFRTHHNSLMSLACQETI